jgi:hypothetical protein
MLKLLTAPTDVPVALADAKTHLRVDVSDDDTLITSMLVGGDGLGRAQARPRADAADLAARARFVLR